MDKFDSEDIIAYKELIESSEGVTLEVWPTIRGFTLVDPSPEGETELSMSRLFNSRITLSRINLTKRRQGTMTKIFQLSCNICRKHGIKSFVVQSTITPEMVAWCVKNGLKPVQYSCFEADDVLYGDYICDVE